MGVSYVLNYQVMQNQNYQWIFMVLREISIVTFFNCCSTAQLSIYSLMLFETLHKCIYGGIIEPEKSQLEICICLYLQWHENKKTKNVGDEHNV